MDNELTTIVVGDNTQQWVFEEIMKRLVAQGGQSISKHSSCLYVCLTGPHAGRRCAVGWLLDNPARFVHCGTIPFVCMSYTAEAIGVNGEWIKEHEDFLSEVQRLHDMRTQAAREQIMDKLVAKFNIYQTPEAYEWANMGEAG